VAGGWLAANSKQQAAESEAVSSGCHFEHPESIHAAIHD
jgi:hypothetical protein